MMLANVHDPKSEFPSNLPQDVEVAYLLSRLDGLKRQDHGLCGSRGQRLQSTVLTVGFGVQDMRRKAGRLQAVSIL